MVTEFVSAQSEWIATQESSIMAQMTHYIDDRMNVELSVTERLVEMINSNIEANTPIHHQWQIASDSIAVRKERLVYPPAPPAIVPVINEFQPSHFNDEQCEYAVRMLNELQLGGHLLRDDLINWINICSSGLGPLGNCFSGEQTFYSLVLPKIWRTDRDDVISKMYEAEAIAGTKETTGIVAVESVLKSAHGYGEARYEVMKKWTGSL
jgi:hypothetical protein